MDAPGLGVGTAVPRQGDRRILVKTPNGDELDMAKYLIVWKCVDGEWYVAALSFTSDAPAPVPMK